MHTEALYRPVLEVAQELGLEVEEAGEEYRARCPVHEDQTPSLYLNPQKNNWYCFGCSKGGGAPHLVKFLTGCSWEEAVNRTATPLAHSFPFLTERENGGTIDPTEVQWLVVAKYGRQVLLEKGFDEAQKVMKEMEDQIRGE